LDEKMEEERRRKEIGGKSKVIIVMGYEEKISERE
jgi:hypothetical protein